MGKLTATEVKQAKPGEKVLKLADGGGMYLQVHPNGARYLRYDYRYANNRKTLALGVYPEVSLKEAREKHQEVRSKLSQGIDSGDVRKEEKLTRHLAAAESLEAVGREWFNQIMPKKSKSCTDLTGRILEKDLSFYKSKDAVQTLAGVVRCP